MDLKNIQRFLELDSSVTISTNEIEHHGLDPWVQWVSVHTGVPHESHQIDHLAETNNLKYPQIWDVLGKEGYTSGLWGIMNSSKRIHKIVSSSFQILGLSMKKLFQKM